MNEAGIEAERLLVEPVAACELPTPWATFRLHGFVDADSGAEHLALVLGDLSGDEPVLVRVHSECLTGDALFSRRCDCGAQLREAMKRIASEGRGAVLYLRQPLHPQSATAIRAAIAGGEPWQALVPAAVARYIERHGLYARAAAGDGDINGAPPGARL